MKKLTEYLKSIGFKPSRNDEDFFSSAMPGKCDIRYQKGGDVFIFGLNEVNYPPTLISPRPELTVGGDDHAKWFDKYINRVLEDFSPEDIIQHIKTGSRFIYES